MITGEEGMNESGEIPLAFSVESITVTNNKVPQLSWHVI